MFFPLLKKKDRGFFELTVSHILHRSDTKKTIKNFESYILS